MILDLMLWSDNKAKIIRGVTARARLLPGPVTARPGYYWAGDGERPVATRAGDGEGAVIGS